MLRSMTGYARKESDTPAGQLTWEIRSVNHRYLETLARLPEALRGLDAEVRQRLGARLGRGRVEATLTARNAADPDRLGRLNLPVARQLLHHASSVAAEMDEAAPLSPIDVLRWPGVLEPVEPDPGPLVPAALSLLDEALEELVSTRRREGGRLESIVRSRLDEIEERRRAVQARLPEVLAAIGERLRARLAGLETGGDAGRIEQELLIVAQKMDVTEELERLEVHLVEFRRALDTDEPVGRRLDFLVQELNREANTLASKSADAETTGQAVDIKVLIEQIREQIQNVE